MDCSREKAEHEPWHGLGSWSERQGLRGVSRGFPVSERTFAMGLVVGTKFWELQRLARLAPALSPCQRVSDQNLLAIISHPSAVVRPGKDGAELFIIQLRRLRP